MKKKASFIENLENTEEVVEETVENETKEEPENSEEVAEEQGESEEVTEPKKGARINALLPSLKRMKKIVDSIDINNLSPADKLDLKMSDMFLSFLKETIRKIVNNIED